MTQAQCKYVEENVYEEPISTIRPATNPFDKIVTRTFAIICFVMAITLAIIISAATVMRYVLEMDLYGYEEWIKIFAFWLYFMGADTVPSPDRMSQPTLFSLTLKKGL